jgi:hypothetical protein
MMFHLSCENWSFDPGLQIIHADVLLKIGDDVLIDEPVCVDVGLPALLLSALQNTEPNRWAPPEEWHRMPFFCCGCGDPECRAFSFRVKHEGDTVRFIELEERQNSRPREMSAFDIPAGEYRTSILNIGKQFLSFIEGLEYKPYFKGTVLEIKRLTERLESSIPGV